MARKVDPLHEGIGVAVDFDDFNKRAGLFMPA